MLCWRKVNTKYYCQIVSPINRLKRFILCSMVKINNEDYDDVIDIDECTVELRTTTYKNWNKPYMAFKMFNIVKLPYIAKISLKKYSIKLDFFLHVNIFFYIF